jgi:iron-sulfur cluster assembly protein
MENVSVLPVKITPNALQEIRQLFDSSVTDTSKMLRIGVKGGGCSGLSYVLEMDERKERDEVFEVEGITCIIDPAHSMYLFGMEIDWKKGLDARGFVFNNPNAAATCGCGTSFSI